MKKTLSTFQVLCFIYVVLIAAWYVLWLTVGDGNWWLTLVNRTVPYLFLPVPLTLMRALVCRDFKDLLPLLFPVLIFLNLYYPYLLPKLVQQDANDAQLRVMTFNVLYSNRDYDAVVNVILTYRPDLVALQEVQPEMMKALEERLKEAYPFSRMADEHDYGTTAVFSRYPFTDAYILDLQADRPAVVVRTKVHEKELMFAAVHLLAYGLQWVRPKDIPVAVMQRTSDQNRQVEILLEEFQSQKGMFLLGCDCNSKETSSSYRMLDRQLDNSARESGGFWNSSELANVQPDLALQHIDYVWYRGSLKPIEVFTVRHSGGSDHLPVMAIFDLE